MLFLLILFCFFGSGFPGVSADEGWNGKPSETPPAGRGTETEPYLISSAAELAWFRDEVNSYDKHAHAKLTADIDLNMQKWDPIGSYGKAYSGVFDGAGHSVSGLRIDVVFSSYNQKNRIGFFSVLNGTVKNLLLSGDITTSNGGASCELKIGGICGEMHGGTISDCTVDVDISYDKNGSGWASDGGGIIGVIESEEPVDISRVVNEGKIKGDFAHAGGLIGIASRDKKIRILHAINRGEVSCGYEGYSNTKGIGGLIGIEDSKDFYMTDSYNSGNVQNVTGNGAGGIAGVMPFSSEKLSRVYYLKGTAMTTIVGGKSGGGVSSGVGPKGYEMTAGQFASGLCAYSMGMGQHIGEDTLPEFLDAEASNRVFKATFCSKSQIVLADVFFNKGATVTELAGNVTILKGYERWLDANGNEVTTLTEDITLYGVGNTPPLLADDGERQVQVKPGRSFSMSLDDLFTDVDGDELIFKVSRDGAAAVLTDADFAFTPESFGTYRFVFTANDGTADGNDAFTLTVIAKNHAPVLNGKGESDAWVKLGDTYTLDLNGIFKDEDEDELTYSVSVDGDGYEATGSVYSFKPNSAGEYMLEYVLSFKVTDGEDDGADEYKVTLTAIDTDKPWDGKTVLAPYEGDGTDEKPFKISTPEELAWLSANFKNKYSVILTADIDLNGKEWTPISAFNSDGNFTRGTFDGSGYTVSGMVISNQKGDRWAYGLFGACSLSCIRNLNVKGTINVDEGSRDFYVGGLVGTASRITIEKCSTDVDITCTGENRRYVGGIIGDTAGLDMKQCAAYGTIKKAYCSGGLAGRGGGIISDCYNTGDIYGKNAAGGLFGENLGGAENGILRCFNTGQISGTNNIGAVAGVDYSRESMWQNVYYLDDSAEKPVGEFGQYATVKFATALTAQEIKSSAFVETLNTAAGETVYREGKSNPVFTWLIPDVPTPAKGDVNGDGSVTAGDVTELISAIATGNTGIFDMTAADINGDGSITAEDVAKLILMIQ